MPVPKGQPNRWVSRSHFSPLAESHRRALLTFGSGAWQDVQLASATVAFLFYTVFLFFCFWRTLCTLDAARRVRDSRGDRRDLGNKKKRGILINLVKVQPVTVSSALASLPIIWRFHLLFFYKNKSHQHLQVQRESQVGLWSARRMWGKVRRYLSSNRSWSKC